MINALLISASREGDTGYLTHALPMISQCIEDITDILFIPYAGVTISYDDYAKKVADALSPLNIKLTSIHTLTDKKNAIKNAKAVLVGGGNTFHLLHELYQEGLINPFQEAVQNGCKYIGWSAGSNIAGLSIKTTNDMPIIEPKSFDALQLMPFQINPHYTDYQAPGHNGETREMRLEEFMQVNQTPIIGIQEGSALLRKNDKLQLLGTKEAYLFRNGSKEVIAANSDLSSLLN
ncbi:dipeptidase PepE [Flocculibacter collagenilyticus]|uniref:dipeptidase PepE n=1 Tax=Flocculibacter collagenilyticus TaxID=2744479 RepID=UPI0018F477F7|nr:dipeptidase PepE [Flocculibacter collagenilyticus]